MTKQLCEAVVINDNNLSRAWATAFLYLLQHGGNEISPLVISLSGFGAANEAAETPALRFALDSAYQATDNWDVETVAFTIFPQRYWILSQGDRAKLFAIYRDAFPRLQAMNRRDNRRGLYFERLTMYGRGPCEGNQLERIITQYGPGVRRSKFQATTFDPARDMINEPRMGFPCLQHLTFIPSADGLVVNAFYATQQIFDKAYGNYLGISRLGAFMAHEMQIPLAKVNFFIGVAKLGTTTKGNAKLTSLISIAKAEVAAHAKAA